MSCKSGKRKEEKKVGVGMGRRLKLREEKLGSCGVWRVGGRLSVVRNLIQEKEILL